MATAGFIGELTAIVLRMAGAPGGTTHQAVAEALSTTTARASARIGQLRKRGLIFSVKVHGLHAHHFTAEEDAKAWKAKQQLGKPGWSPLALPGTPKYIVPKPRMQPRPADVVAALSKGWTHDPRYQVGPGEKPPALFSALPLGVYLEA